MRFLLPFLMTAGLLAGGWAAGAAISADPPIIGSTETIMPTHMQNTDAGAVYHSAESRVYSTLANELMAIAPNASHSSVSSLMGDWNYNITGEVSNGWRGSGSNSGAVKLANN